MDIQIVARHTGVTDSERAYAEEKVGKLTRFYGQIHDGEVILDRDGEQAMVEVVLHAGHHHTFVGKEVQADFSAAIDLVADKLGRQLKKYKEKVQSHRVKKLPGSASEREADEETYEDVIEKELK